MKIGSIVWGVTDIHRAVLFWCEALHYYCKHEREDWAILLPKDGDGIQLSLSLVSSPKAKRHHMDLFTENQQQEVERLLNLGASRKQWNYPKDADYVVLQDPDGNPFCVVQI